MAMDWDYDISVAKQKQPNGRKFSQRQIARITGVSRGSVEHVLKSGLKPPQKWLRTPGF